MFDDFQLAVIIPAAGRGSRFASADQAYVAKSKVELDLHGRPVFMRAIDLFTARQEVKQVILAVHPDRVEEFKLRFEDQLRFQGVVIVGGGEKERWETVKLAMQHVDESVTHIAVHDAARPLTSEALIDRVFDAAREHPAVIPAEPVNATLKRVTQSTTESDDPIDKLLGGDDATKTTRIVSETVSREHLYAVQTPQVFERELLERAYTDVESQENVTDDAGLVERLGEPVLVVDGESTNLKITRSEDMELAEAIAQKREQVQKQSAASKLFADDDD